MPIYISCLRPRRGRIMRNRWWSEAELAVMNGNLHRPRRGRIAFEVMRFLRLYGFTVSLETAEP